MINLFFDKPNKFVECINFLNSFEKAPPIVLFGASQVAVNITGFLLKYGFEVSDYFVSNDYVNNKLNIVPDVLTFDEVKLKYDRFILIVASGGVVGLVSNSKEHIECDQVIRIFLWDNSACNYTTPQFNIRYH